MGNAVISANEGARPCALQTQIKSYHRSYRRRLRKLVRHSSRLGDLAYTVPAAAFALESGRVTPDRRGEAVRMVIDGRSLKDVAAILDLAAWTRRLPPEAFRRPLGALPEGVRFARKVGGRVPADPRAVAPWLAAIEAGYDVADENFALWLAGLRICQCLIKLERESLWRLVVPDDGLSMTQRQAQRRRHLSLLQMHR